jgi:GNAT superfamily N-acetyltransferase
MYLSLGLDPAPEWRDAAEEHLISRLGDDLQVAVVDRPAGNRLAASGSAVLMPRLPSPWNVSGRVGYIQWVATDPDMRRRGLGTAVMRLLLDWCVDHGAPSVELHATPDGEPVYRALGFSEVGPHAMRWRSSTDA